MGLAVARRLAAEGYTLILNSRNPEKAQSAIQPARGEVLTVAGDLANPETAERLIRAKFIRPRSTTGRRRRYTTVGNSEPNGSTGTNGSPVLPPSSRPPLWSPRSTREACRRWSSAK
ncbi:MAG: SDR family oxidoreductase [Hydrogenibacillus sp.]|nr:SDR family oxidoreductase [Hydrogenibacillus sp.]